MTEGFTWQALNAMAHFFKYVCRIEEPVFDVKLRKTGTRVPVVLSKGETQRVFENLKTEDGRYELPARLQYGAGLRRSELVRLRIQDVDLERGTITVRLGKGDKDRVTVLPQSLRDEVAKQIERARVIWSRKRRCLTRFKRVKPRDRRFYVEALIRADPTGPHPCGARRVRSCPKPLQAFGVFRLRRICWRMERI